MLLNANPMRTAIYLLILCIIILSMPMFLRVKFDESSFIGQDSYYNYQLAQAVNLKGLVNYDELSFSGREIMYEYGLPLLLSLEPKALSWVLPILLGIASFMLFYFIIKRYDSDIALISSLLLALSPSFIFLFSTSTKFAGAVFLVLLGIYFFLKGTPLDKKIALASFIAVSFFSIEASIILVLAGLFFAYAKKINWGFYFSWLVASLIILIVEFRVGIISFWGFFENLNFGFSNSISTLFFDIGGKHGFGIFIFILAAIGVYARWHERYRYIGIYLAILAILIACAYDSFLVFFANFWMVVLAAYGILYIIDMEWKSRVFRTLTLIVIVCGVLFSGISFLNSVTTAEPSKGILDGIIYLKTINSTDVVFSDYTRGIYINFAGKKNLADANFAGAPELIARLADSDRLIHAKKLPEAMNIIRKYDIKHIWMDKQLEDMFYMNDESELLFILKYSPTRFYKEYDNGDVEIWGVYSER